MDIDTEELVLFIKDRLQEIKRISRSLAVSHVPNVQAAVDQLDRLSESVEAVITFAQYHYNNPIVLPMLKKIANNWPYHEEFKHTWKADE